MAQNYEDIVRTWYEKLRPQFQRQLTVRYPGLTLNDAEDLYQDAFVAIYENLMKGTVRENTSWTSYITTIGMNLAGKLWRRKGIIDTLDGKVACDDDGERRPNETIDLEAMLRNIHSGEGLYDTPELQAVVGNELKHTPGPCATIISLYYGWDDNRGLSMKEIALRLGLKNADTAKTKKSQCMTDLIRRVAESATKAGFNLKPKERNRNGKN